MSFSRVALFCLVFVGLASQAVATNLTATPRRALTMVYRLPEAISIIGDGESSFPVRLADSSRYYFDYSVGGEEYVFAWTKNDGNARYSDSGLTFGKGYTATFDRAVAVFDPETAYPVKAHDGRSLTIVWTSGSRRLETKVARSHFTVAMSSPTTGQSEGNPVMAGLADAAEIAALKEARRSPDPDWLMRSQWAEAVCTLEEDGRAGTGFVMWMEGNFYVITNQHVAFGMRHPEIRTVSGRTFTPLCIEAAEDRDIARILIDERPLAFSKMRQAQLEEQVFVLGNSDGAGRITSLQGRVNGRSAKEIELTAEFVKGNSGSPIISESGMILGVATYLELPPDPESETNTVTPKRIGSVLDEEIEWLPVNWELALQRSRQYERLETIALETVGMMALIWQFATGPIYVELSDPGLAAWLERRNTMVNEWHDRLQAYRNQVITRERIAEIEGLSRQRIRDTVMSQNHLSQVLARYRQQARVMRLHPDSSYHRARVERLNEIYDYALEISEAFVKAIQSSKIMLEDGS